MTVAVSHIIVDESLTHSSVQRGFSSLKLHTFVDVQLVTTVFQLG